MPWARKLGKPTDQRMAMLKNQVSDLLWLGKIETTLTRAKEVSRLAEKTLTLAINTYEDTVKLSRTEKDEKGKEKTVEYYNDGIKKLNARRRILNNVVTLREAKKPDETKTAYTLRTKDVKYPLVEKIFNELAPKYAERAKEKGQFGGYTRIIKTGMRRGDSAEMAIIELV